MPKFLVTNCTVDGDAGGVYLLDTEGGAPRQLVRHAMRGVTRGPDGYYAVGNGGTVFHLDPRTWEATVRAETGYDGSHDLRWDGGSFYLVACKGNRVLRFNAEFRLQDELRIVADDGDVCHANCLLNVNGEWLLSIFTLSPGRREEKRLTDDWRHHGKVLRLDWERHSYDVLYEPLSQPHSLIPWHGALYACESYTSKVVALDLAAGTKRVVHEQKGFVRGLAFVDGLAYLGVSETRTSGLQQLINQLRGSFVVEMDPATWQPRRRFRLPGTEVYEILPLSDA